MSRRWRRAATKCLAYRRCGGRSDRRRGDLRESWPATAARGRHRPQETECAGRSRCAHSGPARGSSPARASGGSRAPRPGRPAWRPQRRHQRTSCSHAGRPPSRRRPWARDRSGSETAARPRRSKNPRRYRRTSSALSSTGTSRARPSSARRRSRCSGVIADVSPGQPIQFPDPRSWTVRRPVARPPEEGVMRRRLPRTEAVTGRRFDTMVRRGSLI